MTRTHRERLLKNGFIREVMKGWYIPTRPDEPAGESTAWYASFWAFCADYLNERFGEAWCLSPEQSLTIHAGDWTVPRQMLVRSPKGGNKPTALPHTTSILDVRLELPQKQDIETKDGLRVFRLPAALIAIPPAYFTAHPVPVRAALSAVTDASDVLSRLLKGGHSTIAGRLAGAFRNIGRTQIADDILGAMTAAGYTVNEAAAFADQAPIIFGLRETSPYVNRVRMDWQRMREDVLAHFIQPPAQKPDKTAYLKHVDDVYVRDAYNSLSIEGYRVSAELIERARSGNWNPEANAADRNHRDASAARGYWQAFQQLKQSLDKVLNGQNAGAVASHDHRTWYRELFGPSVVAGIIRATDLAGYRNNPVYLRHSMHVPPRYESVRELMPAYFDLLQNEEEPAVRVVLGHFVFVYIHPYMDGNGRMGRFLMNVMLASGGYPWTVVPLERRDEYMAALEQASVNKNIVPFTQLIRVLVESEK
ncbi:MAG: Fic family protein [Gammaproteobacteria bacterium]|nr:Fic family protein [Gammaproteobacteria bacterium]